MITNHAYQTHEDCEYGYKVLCCYNDNYSKPIQKYENTVYKFMEKMLEEVEYCKGVVKLVMTENEKLCFRLMDKCHICVKNILTKMCVLETIVTSLENSGHQECNLKLRIKPEDIKMPVIFHNL